MHEGKICKRGGKGMNELIFTAEELLKMALIDALSFTGSTGSFSSGSLRRY